MRIIDLSAGLDFKQIDDLLESSEEELHLDHTVRNIVTDVRQRGDAAVCDYTRKFDDYGLTAGSIRVSEAFRLSKVDFREVRDCIIVDARLALAASRWRAAPTIVCRSLNKPQIGTEISAPNI